MKQDVMLSICGIQRYEGQEPDKIELMTVGTLEALAEDTWLVTYEESELTGLTGTSTTFRVRPGRVELSRAGSLESSMIFEEGVQHDSLYQMEFGALRVSVCAKKIRCSLTEAGGSIQVLYSIGIEDDTMGTVEYRIEVQPRDEK